MSMENDNRALGAMVMEAAQREAGLRSYILQQQEELDRLRAELQAQKEPPEKPSRMRVAGGAA